MKSSADFGKHFQSFNRIILNYLGANQKTETRVSPAADRVGRNGKDDLAVPLQGRPIKAILRDCETYLNLSVRTGHPQFFNQLFGGFSLPGYLGECITALSNTSMYTREVAPFATKIEKILVDKMLSLAGFKSGEGIFTTGGSNSNLVALLSARERYFPEGKKRGLSEAPRLTLFVSQDAHYSLSKAANILGLGMDACVKIPTDLLGRMKVDELELMIRQAKNQGKTPFFIGATAGSTVRGAFDPIAKLNQVAKAHKLWLHVDGSWGGSVLLSRKHRGLMKGMAQADSLAWDAHKMMGAPLIASVILINHKKGSARNHGLLKRINDTSGVDYLFHDENQNATSDLGQISLQCGRRVDALKLWLIWRHLGDAGLEKNIDHLFELVAYARKKVKSHPRMFLADEPMSLNLCFRYIPEGDLKDKQIDQININIREGLRQSGKALINYGRINDRVVLRLIVVNFALVKKDLDRLFESIISEGEKWS